MNNVYSVSQVNQYIKGMFTSDYALNNISIKGEVSNCKYHTSGHIYFTLKDRSSAMACVMFSSARRGLAFKMSEGQQVVVTGSVSVYERDGRYQLYAKEIIKDGVGQLYEKFEALKAELDKEGFFRQEHKKPIPKYSRTIGIVTASTGAAIQDIIQISARRNPYVQLLLYPATVQGETAAATIVDGIRALDAYGVDTMIVGRGGGSIEDLWAFNERVVAQAIYECKTPIISAVGHEVDVTIADFVADLRAPTPSAAAELAVWDFMQFTQQLTDYNYRLNTLLKRRLGDSKARLTYYQLKMSHHSPVNQIREKRQMLMDCEEKLNYRMNMVVKDYRRRAEIYRGRLLGLSPLNKLKGGYAYVEDDKGKGLVTIKQARPGDMLHIHLVDGQVEAQVKSASAERRTKDGKE